MKKTSLFFLCLFLLQSVFAAENLTILNETYNSKNLEQEIATLKTDIKNFKSTNNIMYFGTLPIVVSPYFGIESAYDGSDVIDNLPLVNEDLGWLQLKQELDDYVVKNNIKIPTQPVVYLSGTIEGRVFFTPQDYTGGRKSDIYLNQLDLDIVSEISPWVSGALFVTYDDTESLDIIGQGNGSRLYLDTGFITVGNFNESPFYATLGQVYVPFGRFLYMVTEPITEFLARSKQRALILGYNHGLYGTVYGYKGDTYTSDQNSVVNGWGCDFGFKAAWQKIGADLGVSYTNNFANSQGILNSVFSSHKQLKHFVPAVSVHSTLQYGDYSFIAEYDGAIRAFDQTYDMSFNGHGARPQGLDIEAKYAFKVMDKPSSVSCGYSRTWESLSVELPERSAFIALSTSLFRSTAEAIEFRHDWNYAKSDTAMNDERGTFSPTGARTRNIIAVEVDVYF